MGFKMVIVPPNTQPDWPEKIRTVVPDCDVQMFNSAEAALDAIVEADAAYGNIGPELLQRARKLRWIQAPAAAPPAGYYYKELIESHVVVTNQREIYNDHIGAHIMAFILAFARGLHRYLPRSGTTTPKAMASMPAGPRRPRVSKTSDVRLTYTPCCRRPISSS